MAIKFNSITFDIKDLILIIGVVVYVLRSENKQDERYANLVAQIQQVVSDNKVQEVKVNARFDAMLSKRTSDKSTSNRMIQFVAVCNDNRLEIVKKRLVKFRLV